MKKIYLDSCVIIYSHESKQETQDRIFRLLFQENSQSNLIYTTELSRFECLIKPIRDKNYQLIAFYKDFFQLPEVNLIQFSREIFDIGADVRAKRNLRTPDALHFAAAIHADCDEFWTNDVRFEKAVEGKIMVRIIS